MRFIGNLYPKNKDNCSEGPTVAGISKFIAKVRETCSIVNAPRRERARTVCTTVNIETVAESVR